MSEKDLSVTEEQALTAPTASRLLEMAVDKDLDVEKLGKLVELQERLLDRQAAEEFAAAMARFQAECPPIPKTSTVSFPGGGGSQVKYKYAELDTIADHIRPLLRDCGLAYTWDSDFTDTHIECTCTVQHTGGHSKSSKFTAPLDTPARMSGAQKNAAALTFARRMSLIQVLGLTTTESDTDGVTGSLEPISEQQVRDLELLLENCGGNLQRLLKFMGVSALSEIPASSYHIAVQAVESKRRGA